MESLNGKVVVITGASSGIGAALGKLVARGGAITVLVARREKHLSDLAGEINGRGGKAICIVCDVSHSAAAAEMMHNVLKEFGHVDVLVNNAGRGHFGSVEHTSDEIIRNMFSVNVFSLWNTVRPVLPSMKARGAGHIINIASMAGKVGYPYNSAYVSAKHACVGFTHALRSELLGTNIHATVVCPAGVLTNWAASTEGGSMISFFSQSGPAIKRIAKERGLSPPEIEGVKSAADIADQILQCIYHPVAELYTHAGSKEFALLAASDRERAEQYLLPVVLGEREAYEKVKGTSQ